MEVHLYIAGSVVVTARRGSCAQMDLLRDRLEPEREAHAEDYLVHRLLDGLTRLGVLATFFVVGTLITGFFGRNFGWLVDNIDSR